MKQLVENLKPSPADTNKQILEVKKKIQLSEGQRKAVFEDCEAEKKSNSEEIQRLKADVSSLVVQLKDTRKSTTTLKIYLKRIEGLVGPVEDKKADEVGALLDLQIVDKNKMLDLVRYKIDKRRKYLAELAKECRVMLTEKGLKQVARNVDRPAKRAVCELQNSIHAVEVQLREANHISVRYKDIKKSLLNDSARFESTIKNLEQELESQSSDINKLQQVTNEASRMRGVARGHLLKEEKQTLSSAHQREKQTAEGTRLVNSRRQEMEMLEKRIFQSGKTAIRQDANEDAHATDDELTETPQEPADEMAENFEALKKATGAANPEEVLQRFSAQKDTFARLVVLRQKSETDKRRLEKHLESLRARLENFKYAEAKETEKKSVKMEEIQKEIEQERARSQNAQNLKSSKEKSMKSILRSLQELHLCVDPLTIPDSNLVGILQKILDGLHDILSKSDQEVCLGVEGVEEKWLPSLYSGLVRRTPLPQPGISPAPPPPPGSEDEEEVPSRGYLKRQAQLVVDAKSRRKNVRMLTRRN